MPTVTFALFATHFRRHLGLALSKLDDILSEHGQPSGLIADDAESQGIGRKFQLPEQTINEGLNGLFAKNRCCPGEDTQPGACVSSNPLASLELEPPCQICERVSVMDCPKP